MGSTKTEQTQEFDSKNLSLVVTARGKLPVVLAPVTIFPLVGLQYILNLNTDGKDTMTATQKADMNDVLVDLGAGIDYPISENLYLRAEGVYGLNLTLETKSLEDQAKALGLKFSALGSRINVSVGVGAKL